MLKIAVEQGVDRNRGAFTEMLQLRLILSWNAIREIVIRKEKDSLLFSQLVESLYDVS